MQFEWDEQKATTNLTKHGVSFEESLTVFEIPFRTQFPIPIEHRFIIIGATESGKILVVANTDDGHTVRIISAREATHGERQCYEEG